MRGCLDMRGMYDFLPHLTQSKRAGHVTFEHNELSSNPKPYHASNTTSIAMQPEAFKTLGPGCRVWISNSTNLAMARWKVITSTASKHEA